MENTAIYRFALENFVDTILITDEKGVFSFICPNVHFIFGYSSEEVLKMGNIKHLTGDLPGKHILKDPSGEITNHELSIKTKSNEKRVVLMNLKMLDIEGKARLYSFRDITGLKALERRNLGMFQKNKLFNMLAANLPMVFWVWSTDFRKILYVSQLFEEFWGVNSEAVAKKPLSWLDSIHPDDKETVQHFIDSPTPHILSAASISFPSFRLIGPNDKIRWMETKAFPIRDRKGRTRLLAGYAEDVTLRRQAENNLLKMQRRVRALWDIYGLEDKDKKTICCSILEKIVQLTESVYGFYGFVNEEEDLVTIYAWSKTTMEECHIPENSIELQISRAGLWANAIRRKEPVMSNDYYDECPLNKGLLAGHVGLGRILSVPVLVSGRVVAIGAVVNKNSDYNQDDVWIIKSFLTQAQLIIDRKEKETALQIAHETLEARIQLRTEELKKANIQLLHAEKLAAVGRLSASFAHEFNNPLFGVTNILNGLQRYATLDAQDAEMVGLALQECGRMKNLVSELLNMGRPSNSQKMSTDMHQLIDQVLVLCGKYPRTNDILFQKEYCPAVPMIEVIQDQMKQVILNLLHNAMDACAEQEAGIITLRTSASDSEFHIHIEDNGKGIPETIAEKVFEPFFTTKSSNSGTGLGLPVSYGIIRSHDGSIDFTSSLGSGTIFSITLPLSA